MISQKIFNIIQILKWNFKTIGYTDLELGFIFNNSHQLNQIMDNLSNKFPG